MTESKDLTISDQQQTEKVLNSVINQLRGIFPSWRSSIKSTKELNNLKIQWLAAFIENNIKTDTQINKGLSAARKSTSPFIPSIGQFIEWCRTPTTSTYNEMLDNMQEDEKKSPLDASIYLKEKCPWYSPKNLPEEEVEEESDEEADKKLQYETTGTYVKEEE